MAIVTSDDDLTVIILNGVEASALADLLEVSDSEDNSALNELTNAMIGEDF